MGSSWPKPRGSKRRLRVFRLGGSIGADALPPGWDTNSHFPTSARLPVWLHPFLTVVSGPRKVGEVGADPRDRSTAGLETALRTENVCVCVFLQAAHVDAPRAARSCQETSSAGSGHHDLLIILSLRAPRATRNAPQVSGSLPSHAAAQEVREFQTSSIPESAPDTHTPVR